MQSINLFIARLFYPETFPRKPLFRGAPKTGALVLLIAKAIAVAWVLS